MASPPSLDYSLRDRRKSQIIIFSVIVFVNAGLPNLVFYLIRHYTSMQPIAVNAIVAAVFALGLVQLPLRLLLLLRKGGERSPLPKNQSGAPSIQKECPEWYEQIDVFQWEFAGCALFTTIFFIISCSSNGTQGYFPFLVLAPSLLVAQVGTQVVGASFLNLIGFKLPFRFGSVPKGDIIRPAPYYIWEDLVAVDGGGGAEFRARFDARYRASPPFQEMLRNLGFMMGSGGIALLAMELGLTFSGRSEDIIYGSSMAIAVVWATVGATVAIIYCRWALRKERAWFILRAVDEIDEAEEIESVKGLSTTPPDTKKSATLDTNTVPIQVVDFIST